MTKFTMSPQDVRDLCKAYPNAEQIAELKAHHAPGSEITRLCEYMLELTKDLKSSLPAPPAAAPTTPAPTA